MRVFFPTQLLRERYCGISSQFPFFATLIFLPSISQQSPHLLVFGAGEGGSEQLLGGWKSSHAFTYQLHNNEKSSTHLASPTFIFRESAQRMERVVNL